VRPAARGGAKLLGMFRLTKAHLELKQRFEVLEAIVITLKNENLRLRNRIADLEKRFTLPAGPDLAPTAQPHDSLPDPPKQ